MTEMLYEWLRAFAGLWTSPYYYVALLWIAFLVRRQITLERRLFSVKLHSWWGEWRRTALWGAAVGAVVSAAFLLIGAVVTPSALLLLWIAAALLSLVRVRFFCFAYAAGALGLLKVALGWADAASLPAGVAMAANAVASLHMPSLLALVGLLHLAEAALVWKLAGRMATPLFFEGKRGKPVGGYWLQAFWPVPLLMLVPFGAAGGVAGALPWPTLFGGAGWPDGWQALAFPALIGYNAIALSGLPGRKARASALRLAGYGAVVFGLGVAVFFAPYWWAIAAAAALSVALHEWIALADRRRETAGAPYFVHDERGLKVLAVQPGSPAAELGIEPGHVLRKVNGERVRDRAELHAALRLNAAFTKLEVLNHDGESRFLQRALFANEHHQLGIVLCPDEQVLHVAELKEGGLLSFLRSKRSRSRGGEPLALPPGTPGVPGAPGGGAGSSGTLGT